MATFQELGRGYARRILDKPSIPEGTRIASEINGLVYEGTNTPVSKSDKQRIVREIREGFAYHRPDINWNFKSSNNQEYLDLVDHILDQVD